MHWNSISEFFAMGGYAFYVWGSFGATAVAVLIEIVLVRGQREAVLQYVHSELQLKREIPHEISS
jgi:heme exporter protein D